MGLGVWCFGWLVVLLRKLGLGPALPAPHARERPPMSFVGAHCVVLAGDLHYNRPEVEIGHASGAMPIMTSRRDMIRGLLAGILSAAGAVPVAHAAGETPKAADFIAFSERLMEVKGLDPGMGADILGAFVDVGQGEALASLMTQTGPIDAGNTMANAVVAAWYSGLSTRTAGEIVTDFNGALMWDALSFTKPWGSCGGATGYWGDPPSG